MFLTSFLFGTMKKLIACGKNESCLIEKVIIACLDVLNQRSAGKGKKESVLNGLSEEYQLLCNPSLQKPND